MAQKLNSFERFWKELKRRKVVHVITVYAAVAFVILQLVDVISEPLRLPVSTKALVIVLLCIGFIIAILVSWVYDITPAGVKKTKPAWAVRQIDQTAKPASIGWKIATCVSVVIIIALLAFNFISKRNLNADISKLEKSIAVLPFKSLSTDPEKQYQADGMMDDITLHLSKIKDLRVLGRTSTEQYRNPTKTLTAIGKELGVSYLLEGSFQKFGDSVRLIVQLMKAGKEGHVWANNYDRLWKNVFSVQSEVAQSIARELKAVITPEEKALIEKAPTTDSTAYDFYLQGREEQAKYWNDNWNGYNNIAALQKAEELYHKSLRYDSTFAPAYSGLARVYWDKHYLKGKEYLSKNFGDSVLILTKLALSFDDHLSEPYTLRGRYYREIGKPEQAIEEFDKAIKLNPNDWIAYYQKGMSYFSTDLVNWINYLQKAASINRGKELPQILDEIGWAYMNAGFIDKAKQHYQEKLILDGDSLSYYINLRDIEFWGNANFNKSLEYAEKCYVIDSTNMDILNGLGIVYGWLGHYKESLKYYKKWYERIITQGKLDVQNMYRIGYAYWQCGFIEEAKYYFNEQIKNSNSMIELNRWVYGQYAYYDLAAVYAFIGEKDKAYKNLRIFNQIIHVNIQVLTLIKTDPLFNSIRNEPEFQQIAREIEAKYQAEHERVKKWLEEQGMLN